MVKVELIWITMVFSIFFKKMTFYETWFLSDPAIHGLLLHGRLRVRDAVEGKYD